MPEDQGVILYAEDDPLTRMSVLAALEEAGFVVQEASNGEEALSALLSPEKIISGLVTDINLGSGADGWELARNARDNASTIPVIYISAESEDLWAANGVPNSVFVSKPFDVSQIVVALAGLLNTSDITL